jgi:hypothetical protein
MSQMSLTSDFKRMAISVPASTDPLPGWKNSHLVWGVRDIPPAPIGNVPAAFGSTTHGTLKVEFVGSDAAALGRQFAERSRSTLLLIRHGFELEAKDSPFYGQSPVMGLYDVSSGDGRAIIWGVHASSPSGVARVCRLQPETASFSHNKTTSVATFDFSS